MKRWKAIWLVIIVALFCIAAQAQNQGQSVDAILDDSFRSMYNLQFDQALSKAEQAKQVDKTDPMPWVAQASAILFREFDRLHILRSDLFASDDAFSSRPAYSWVPASRKQFDDAIAGGEKIAQDRLNRDKKDVKALFALALFNGLRADDAALITKRNLTALSYTKSSTGYADKLLAIAPDYYDAYIATGMGKYLIGGKPAPVRWILRIGGLKGDQEEGLKELRLTAERGRYLAPFARILLAFDDLRHKDKTAARKKFESLREQFPSNPLFAQEIQKCNGVSVSGGQ
ncbi:MAG: hypothetical protein DMG65_10250 [Candidatus Angelobacter sp. Gp1-AA117]|nr:MAG: hypothetical protein DMG65_10250 [Candidatus Angelobacter sp. Gp1-AA117]